MTPDASRPSDPLAALENTLVDHLFVLQPGYAVFLGLHRYDGLLPDLSRGATDAWIAKARELLAGVRDIRRDALPHARRLDHHLLELLLEGPLFDLVEGRDLERNPMSYVGGISLTA